MRIVLASASPRRLQLLQGAGFDVDVRPSHVDETPHANEAPATLVQRLARAKAAAVDVAGAIVVVGADTTVVLAGRALEKPVDAADAKRMLASLSGHAHDVLTGWCVRRGDTERVGVVSTSVSFRALTAAEIDAYVATGEPLDKAGAYGIQGLGGALVDVVHGSYTNVVGLPVAEVVAAIRELLA